MPPRPQKQASGTLSKQRTQPALPGATLPTAPIASASPPPRYTKPLPIVKKHMAWRTTLQLIGLGIVLAVLLVGLYPLLIGPPNPTDVVQPALPGLFPWLPHLYWTLAVPSVAQLLTHISWLNPLTPGPTGIGPGMGAANLAFFLLLLASLLTLLASQAGRRVAQGGQRLSSAEVRALFLTVMILTGVFGLILLFAPIASNALSRDMVLYGLYGRMVVLYHVANPYIALPTQGQDALQTMLQVHSGAPFGPFWLDLSILVSLIANTSIANLLLGFRVIGLLAHLSNAVLIWLILSKVKPELRISSTLLYAWNPLVLLLSVYQLHLEVVLVLFVLLAVFFFQHHAPTLSWVFLLFAGMIHLFCLLLLPLFLLVALKESRVLGPGRRVVWWLGMFVITALVVALAYVPYWRDWGITGLWANVRQIFWPDVAVNSLAAALGSLPVSMQPVVHWLAAPHHWDFLLLLLVGSILLLGMWLTSTVDLALLFSAWIFLVAFVVGPVNWPWYILLPLMLALIAANRQTLLLAVLLTIGALLSYYGWLWPSVWAGQGLVIIGLPLLVWGWTIFFSSTWQMTHAQNEEETKKLQKRAMRTSWPSRPSWPSRRTRG